MRALMISKALVVGEYQGKVRKMGCQPGIDLTVVVPPSWRDERGDLKLERTDAQGYRLIVAPLRLNGHFHLHYYPTIGSIIGQVQPDIIHVDEEPYNFATYHAFRAASRRAPAAHRVFFTWQNILRRTAPPFSWMEHYVLRHAALALAGSAAAADVLRQKGFVGRSSVIPQFGVEQDVFSPVARAARKFPPVIGMAGRLVPEKGTDLLLRVLAGIDAEWKLQIVGSGPQRKRLDELADELRIASRIDFLPWRPSSEMPDFYRGLDLLVVPSLTRPNWKEQFGRVLVEAMACGVPVVGSDSGEIPNVIGDAGIIVPEGNVDALSAAIRSLIADEERRVELGRRARRRVLDHYTQDRIAALTVDAYRSIA